MTMMPLGSTLIIAAGQVTTPVLEPHSPRSSRQGLREFSMVPGAAAYGRSACSASTVISGTVMSGASTGGMAIASTGGMAIASTGGMAIASTGGMAIASTGGMAIGSTGGTASGPASDGRPSSMAASACAASASPKSASDGESSAPCPAGVIFSKNLEQLDRYRHDQRAVLLPGHLNHGLQQPQLQRRGVAGHHVGRHGQPLGGLVLAVGGDDPGPALSFRLGLPGHGPLHAVGQRDVLDLHPLDPDAPRALGRLIDDAAQARVTESRSASSWSISDWPMIDRRDVCAC